MNSPVTCRFLVLIEDGYRDNPYHNRVHAADVLRNLHVIIHRGGLLRLIAGRTRGGGGGGGSGGQAHPPGNSVAAGRSSRLQSEGTLTAEPSTVRPASGHHHNQPHRRSSMCSRSSCGSMQGQQRTSCNNRASPSAGAPPSGQAEALTLLAMYLAAIIHDYDHRGVTNAFLIQDQDPLAVRGWLGGGVAGGVAGGTFSSSRTIQDPLAVRE